MQLDDWKGAWAAHASALERSLSIDERLLREVLLRKVRFALAPYVLWRALDVVLGIAAILVVVPVLAAHVSEPRYVVIAGAVAAFAILITALCAYSLVNSLQLDYDGPVTAIQRDVARLQIVEYRTIRWALLGGIVLWLPASLVAYEALTGIDALARVHLAYLVANLVFGLVLFAIGQWWSRKYVERSDPKPWARRFVVALSGRSLRSATALLAELARFEREE